MSLFLCKSYNEEMQESECSARRLLMWEEKEDSLPVTFPLCDTCKQDWDTYSSTSSTLEKLQKSRKSHKDIVEE